MLIHGRTQVGIISVMRMDELEEKSQLCFCLFMHTVDGEEGRGVIRGVLEKSETSTQSARRLALNLQHSCMELNLN